MTRCKIIIPMIAAAALATPAFAQDREEHFDGFYVGASVGKASAAGKKDANPVQFDTNRDGDYTDTVTTTTGANVFALGFCPGIATGSAPGNCDGDDDDLEYAGRIGYDKRMGNMVVGGLFEASKPQLFDGASAYSTTPAGYHLGRELDYALSARARLGYTPNGGALFYVTGGGSYAKVKHSFTTTNTANTFTQNANDDMVWGWQAGGGAEIMVANNLSLGLEYLYNRYNDDKYYVAAGAGTAPTSPLVTGGGTYLRQDPQFQFHTIRATLGLRF